MKQQKKQKYIKVLIWWDTESKQTLVVIEKKSFHLLLQNSQRLKMHAFSTIAWTAKKQSVLFFISCSNVFPSKYLSNIVVACCFVDGYVVELACSVFQMGWSVAHKRNMQQPTSQQAVTMSSFKEAFQLSKADLTTTTEGSTKRNNTRNNDKTNKRKANNKWNNDKRNANNNNNDNNAMHHLKEPDLIDCFLNFGFSL